MGLGGRGVGMGFRIGCLLNLTTTFSLAGEVRIFLFQNYTPLVELAGLKKAISKAKWGDSGITTEVNTLSIPGLK